MGAGVSAGENNDDLIDNLKEANYIRTSLVEKVFRAVDRGAYFLPDPPIDAYRDVAWKNGNFHISAPCIYSEVMEGLKLEPGLSFLNLGSGTGYLNTVAGLILGSYGINHGIELYEDVIQYAYMRLEDFKKNSGAIDEYDFCEPKFMQGNCLCLASGYHLYDRVYCGAACPEKYLNYMKNLIKVGGTLVIPVNERLVEMKRVTETNWTTHYLLPVSFTNLVKPEKGTQEVVPLFDLEPLSLQELCRTTIRNILRKIIEIEHPSFKNYRNTRKPSKKKKAVKKWVFSSLGDPLENTQDAINVLHIIETTRSNNASTSADNPTTNTNNETEEATEEASSSSKEVTAKTTPEETTESKVIVHRENVSDETESNENKQVDKTEENKVSYNIRVEPMVIEEDVSENRENRVEKESSSGNNNIESDGKGKNNNRNKLDSGLGDELVIAELPVDMVEATTSSSDDEHDNRRCKRGKQKVTKKSNSKWRKTDKVDVPKKYSDSDSTDSENNSDTEDEYVEAMNRKKMYISPYTVHMRSKIQELPLPPNMKKFINYYRDF